MALIKDIINGVLETDAYELFYWIEWYFTKGASCKHCVETRAGSSGKPPNCLKCGLPTMKLLNKNFGKKELHNEKNK